MKRFIILFLLFYVSVLTIKAQHRIVGIVTEQANGNKVAFATVSLLSNDSTIVTGNITDNDGGFILDDLVDGSYILRISFIGFETKMLVVHVPKKPDMGIIELIEDNKQLNEVVVTAERPFVVQRRDRYVINVGNQIQTTGRNALEVLSNTPGILVTSDGKLSVMGSDVAIYIDGRPSRLSGDELNALLSATRGETIDRIEVITNPSSRYDASGGSIVDIKTKSGLQYGLNGSVDASYRQGRKDKETGGVSLNYRGRNYNLFGSYSLDRSQLWQRIDQENRINMNDVAYTFRQHGDNESVKANYGQQYRLGMDFFMNDKNTFGVLFSGYHTGDASNRIIGATTITPVLNGVQSTHSDSRRSNENDGKQINLNYVGKLAKPGQQFSVDLDYGRFKSLPFQYNYNEYFDSTQTLIDKAEQLRHQNRQKIDLWSAKVDYMFPFWETGKVEFGAKTSWSKTDNDLFYEKNIASEWETDFDLSNHFIYKEQVHAAYLSLNKRFGKWDFQAGVRGEYTYSKGEQRTTKEVNDTSYFKLFPTAYINYHLSEGQQFNLSYGRRIMRPFYGQLNPFEVKIDAYSFTAGNPYLEPMIMDNFSFSYSDRRGIMIRIAYNLMNDLIIESPVQENDRYGLKYKNFGKRSNAVLMANYRKNFTKWWGANVMVQGVYETNSSHKNDDDFNSDGFGWSVQWQNNLRISSSLSAELSAMYFSSQKMAYYKIKSLANVSFGLRQMLLKNKLSLSLTVNDLFYTYKTDMSTKSQERDYSVKIERDSRWINLGIRYNFGSSQIKGARNRNTGVEEEKQRIK